MYESWSIHLISNLAARQLQERSWRRMRLCQRKWPGPSRASVNSTVLVFRSSRQLTQFLIQHKWNTWPSSTQNKDQNEGIAVLYQDQRKVPHMMFFLCQGHQIVVQQQEEGRNLRFSKGFRGETCVNVGIRWIADWGCDRKTVEQGHQSLLPQIASDLICKAFLVSRLGREDHLIYRERKTSIEYNQ